MLPRARPLPREEAAKSAKIIYFAKMAEIAAFTVSAFCEVHHHFIPSHPTVIREGWLSEPITEFLVKGDVMLFAHKMDRVFFGVGHTFYEFSH